MATYPRCVVRLDVLMEEWGGTDTVLKQVAVVPREVEIRRNDARRADTASITLDLRDFPMDPRTVRNVRVSVLLGNVATVDGQLGDADLAFAGYVDAPEARRAEEGATVRLECRDFTGPLLDAPWTDGLVDVTGTLGEVVAALVGTVPAMDGLTVGYSTGLESAVLSLTLGRTKFAPRKGDDTWTVLTGVCAIIGATPVFVGDLLLILTPDDFGVDRAAFLASDSLAPQSAAYVYGAVDGLASLSIRRKFTGAARRQIRVLCWDETRRKATEATYPSSPVVVSKTVTSTGKVKETAAPQLTFNVAGTYSAGDLATMAQRVYDDVSRNEVEIEIESARMAAGLGNGARITVSIAPSLTTDLAGLSRGEAIAALTRGPRALAPDVAEVFVQGFASAQNLAREFYARDVSHRWSREQGYRMSATLINLVGGTA